MADAPANATVREAPAPPKLIPLRFEELVGFADDDHLAAFAAWRRSAQAIVEGLIPTRAGAPVSPLLRRAARQGLKQTVDSGDAARRFFATFFRPYRVQPGEAGAAGFVTGYYEPLLRGALAPSPEFSAPVLSRPADLVSFPPDETPLGLDSALSGAQRLADGALRPYPDRAAIEAAGESGQMQPILWLEDHVELFLAQVQGSARVQLPDGRLVRLAYDGRNGQPYKSIGRALIDAGAIKAEDMSLARLKAWLRQNGQKLGEAGRDLMQRNASYVFFKLEEHFDTDDGPTGGAGIALTTLRSIAVDRRLWPYGTPFWLDAHLPWRQPAPSAFRRLMIAQDTGSAILGSARADIFFGSGDEAGQRAGDIRHSAGFVVLLPVEDAP